MANRITIDVEARYVDRVSAGMNSAKRSTDGLEKSVEKANKALDRASKKNVKPKLGADDNAFTKKLRQAEDKLNKLGRTKASATIGAIDKASAKIGSVVGAARSFAGKTFKSVLSMKDNASHILGDVIGEARAFAGKTYSAAVKIKDMTVAPLKKIKDSIFNIKTLAASIVLGVATGVATKKGVLEPIQLADAYSSAQIGFSTLLGKERGQEMMDDIDVFAKKTPFKTSNVISNVQKMMAYGWDANKVIEDMETIGDAAAATGKGDEGLESIVYALSEIRSKGKLSTQELNQLASAGIKAKAYLAEGLGFGTDDAGMAKLAEALEDGAVGANQAIELILEGMKEFDGMMDKTANETVEGLKSQLEDVFEINIARRWGQGLQDGAKKGLGSIVSLLNESEDALEDFGDMLYDIGKEISNWGADKLERFVSRVKKIVSTDEFKNASLGEKVKLLFEGSILDPLEEWWNSDKVQTWIYEKKKWLAEKASGWGESIGRGLSNGLLALFGVDVSDAVGDGVSIGASFAKGFAEGFDASAVTKALVKAIKDVWQELPLGIKLLVGGYVGGKAITGLGNFAGALGNLGGIGKALLPAGKAIIGSTGTSMVQGTGLLNVFANAGYGLTGGAATSTLTPAVAAGIGGAGIAGGVAAGVSTIKGIRDLTQSYKAYKAGDKTEAKAKGASGGTTLGGVASGALAGAAIGSVVPILGTAVGALIGAGVGGIAGWIGGNKWGDNIRENAAEIEAAKYASKEMQEAIKNTELSAEELDEIFSKACWDDMKERFGEIELSMEEIESLANKTVFNLDTKNMNKFAEAATKAEQSLSTFHSAASDMERLNFDMTEHRWKMELGIDEKLSDEEIEDVKSRVKSYIESAEAAISDAHYEFNAAIDVLLKPNVAEDDATYKTIIEGGNKVYAKLQKQLDETSKELEAKYNIALKDGVITADEQKILSELQAKIAEIVDKISNAETEASFEVSKIKFTTGELTADSFQQFQSSLQSQMETYISEQEEALTVGISGLKLQLSEGEINETQYKEQLETLINNYDSNIEKMTARVSEIQLEGIADAFDGVGTVEELKSAISSVLEEGKNPMELTFSDIQAHLEIGDDVLSEEAKTNFTSVMQQAIQSFATGENALQAKAEINPEVSLAEGSTESIVEDIRDDLLFPFNTGLAGENALTPGVEILPKPTLAEGASENVVEGIKNDLLVPLNTGLVGENALTANADANITMNTLGTGGIPLADETAKGRTATQSAIDTSFSDSFSASADANVTLNWSITNPSKTLKFSGGGGNGSTVKATIGNNAAGGFISGGPQLSWLDEEGTGEVVIPFNPARRARALKLYEETGRKLGVKNHADGGFIGTAPIQAYEGEIPAAGSGDQTIEVNMGGVTIAITGDGSKSPVENIEDQAEEIAEKVAAIFNQVLKAQFANMPLKGGA